MKEIIDDLKEKLRFNEEEDANTLYSDGEAKNYIRGRLEILRYVIKKLENEETEKLDGDN